MGKRSKEVDAYIAEAAECARPVLERIRDDVHGACPDVEEAMKWNVPWFEYKGLLLGMAAFTNHASFGFWKLKLMDDPDGLFGGAKQGSMCTYKAERVKDLPAKRVMSKYIKAAMALNEQGVKVPMRTGAASKSPPVPTDLAAALKKNAKAKKVYEGFPPSAQRDYVMWIMGAKREETRAKRLATTVEWLALGRKRNWKYSGG